MDLMVSTYDEFVAPRLKVTNGAASHTTNGSGASAPFEKYRAQVEEMMALVRDQREKLAKEVDRWCAERGV